MHSPSGERILDAGKSGKATPSSLETEEEWSVFSAVELCLVRCMERAVMVCPQLRVGEEGKDSTDLPTRCLIPFPLDGGGGGE